MRSSWLARFACAVLLVACDDGYPIAPTPCDGYCLAIQRANCSEDWPEECVSACELTEAPAVRPECAGTFDGYVECLMDASDADFSCVGGRSQPGLHVCQREQVAWAECSDTTGCHAQCRGVVEACPTTAFDGCLTRCFEAQWTCPEEVVEYLDCVARQADGCLATSGPCESRYVALEGCLRSTVGAQP